MAVRFHSGGKLVVFGAFAPCPDGQHVAVEFMHPVIVGKRALPAVSLTADAATVTGIAERDGLGAIFAHQLRYLATPADIALGISADGNSESVLNGLLTAHDMGMLTIALAGAGGGTIGSSPAVDHLIATTGGRPAGRQGGTGDRVPRAVGTGARVFRAARGARPGGGVMSRAS